MSEVSRLRNRKNEGAVQGSDGAEQGACSQGEVEVIILQQQDNCGDIILEEKWDS